VEAQRGPVHLSPSKGLSSLLKKVAVVALAAGLLAGCGGNSTKDEKASGGADGTVRVAIVNSALFSPLYVAQERGYFKQEGITVDLQAVTSGQDAIPLVSSGKLDAAVAGVSAGMFSALNSGLDFKIVGSMGQSTGDPAHSPTTLEVSAAHAGKIKSVADLKGQKVAVAGGPGAAGGYLTDQILRTAGLTIKDITPVNLSNADMITAVKTGSVVAALTSAPFSTQIEAEGTGKPLAVPSKGTTTTTVMYGGAFAKSPYAQKFFNALVKGSRDLQNGGATSPEIVKIVAAATKQSADVVAKSPAYLFDPKLAPSADQLNKMQQSWMAAGLLPYKTPLDPAKFMVSTFSTAAQ
jgi:NitT/TauT family transport system substrate-binding protein